MFSFQTQCLLSILLVVTWPYISCQQMDDYVFDGADIIAELDLTEHVLIVLEAYKAIANEQILNESKNDSMSKLSWVSLGYPTLVAFTSTNNKTRSELFHLSDGGFHAYINMLTPKQRDSIRDKIKLKYHIDVDKSQITNLILNKLECKLQVKCGAEDSSLVLTGRVSDFRRYMLRLKFKWPKGGRHQNKYDTESQRECIEAFLFKVNDNIESASLLNDDEFSMTCHATAIVNSTLATSFSREFNLNMENFDRIVNATASVTTGQAHREDQYENIEKNFESLSKKNDLILEDLNNTNGKFNHIAKQFDDFMETFKNKGLAKKKFILKFFFIFLILNKKKTIKRAQIK
jgi:hypothetical protein